jgi:hypothetical protein
MQHVAVIGYSLEVLEQALAEIGDIDDDDGYSCTDICTYPSLAVNSASAPGSPDNRWPTAAHPVPTTTGAPRGEDHGRDVDKYNLNRDSRQIHRGGH